MGTETCFPPAPLETDVPAQGPAVVRGWVPSNLSTSTLAVRIAAVSDNEERLIELETRLMHQEKLLEQLNEVVTSQHVQIEGLVRAMTQVKEQVLGGNPEDVNEPPPHY